MHSLPTACPGAEPSSRRGAHSVGVKDSLLEGLPSAAPLGEHQLSTGVSGVQSWRPVLWGLQATEPPLCVSPSWSELHVWPGLPFTDPLLLGLPSWRGQSPFGAGEGRPAGCSSSARLMFTTCPRPRGASCATFPLAVWPWGPLCTQSSPFPEALGS